MASPRPYASRCRASNFWFRSLLSGNIVVISIRLQRPAFILTIFEKPARTDLTSKTLFAMTISNCTEAGSQAQGREFQTRSLC